MAIMAFPIQTQTLFDQDNTWTGLNTFGTGVSVLAGDEQPLIVSVLHGSVSSPATQRQPTLGVSRQEAITATADGAQNAAIYARVDSNNVSVAGSNPQTNGILARLTANGDGDACAIFGDTTLNGDGTCYGGFFHIDAAGAGSGGEGIEILVDDNNGVDCSILASGHTDVNGINIEVRGANRAMAALKVADDAGGNWDIGLLFGDCVRTALVYSFAGSYTNGIDLSLGTFSGSPFKSPGFSVSGSGAITASNTWTTFTCTATPGAGAITTQSSNSRYLQIGKLVHVIIEVTISNVGTASGGVTLSLPTANSGGVLSGRENGNTGKAIHFIAGNSISNYDNTAANLANGSQYFITGIYQAT